MIKIFYLVIGVILFINLVNAVDLESELVLNTSISNTSLSINSFNITCDEFSIDEELITLLNCSYSDIALQKSITINMPNYDTDTNVFPSVYSIPLKSSGKYVPDSYIRINDSPPSSDTGHSGGFYIFLVIMGIVGIFLFIKLVVFLVGS